VESIGEQTQHSCRHANKFILVNPFSQIGATWAKFSTVKSIRLAMYGNPVFPMFKTQAMDAMAHELDLFRYDIRPISFQWFSMKGQWDALQFLFFSNLHTVKTEKLLWLR
jgi:hypothetical protein